MDCFSLLRVGIASLSLGMVSQNSLLGSHYQGPGFYLEDGVGGYNTPASVSAPCKSGECLSEFSWFFDVAFTYWYASEEGLRLATNGVLDGTNSYFSIQSNTIFQDFGYRPGFKIGTGLISSSEWEGRLDYTWFNRSSSIKSFSLAGSSVSTAGTAAALSGTPVFLVDNWFMQTNNNLAAIALSSGWHLQMNLLDLTLGRPYYQGKELIVGPFGGLRATFIYQAMQINITQAAGSIVSESGQIGCNTSSKSWGIGPVVGFNGSWLLPEGFRLKGNGLFGLIYTNFTKISHSETQAANTFNPGPYTASYTDYMVLLPNAGLELGIGWSRYLNDGNSHIDLSLLYGFTEYWGQNMMRKLLDDVATGTGSAASSLFLQGLTASLRFDF